MDLSVHSLLAALLLLAGCFAVPTAPASDAHVKQRYLFSFGDSYTTTNFFILGEKPSTSNPFGNPPYPGVTTDNGANWIGVLIKSLSPRGTLSYNFAVAGATVSILRAPNIPTIVPDFIIQTSEFLSTMSPPPEYAQWNGNNSAFAIYFGTNDISVTFGFDKSFPWFKTNEGIFDTYFDRIEKLYAAGARRFLLVGMDPLERTPKYLGFPFYGADTSAIKADVADWNRRLAKGASQFKAKHADVILDILDTQAIFNHVLDHPRQHGAPNNTCSNFDGVSCLWWDTLHPGQAIQKAIAHGAFDSLKSLGFYS